MTSTTVAFYISGHGYGHASRAIEVMNALAARLPELHFCIRTTAPRWLFDLNLRAPHTYANVQVDVGAVQQTSFEIDKPETLRQWQAFLAQKPTWLNRELPFLRQAEARLLLGDIPPLAFELARHAGVPSVAIANFSWDWIFASYVAELPAFAEVIEAIREGYGMADLLLRLPMHGDLSAFSRSVDIPLIARNPRPASPEVRQRLGVPGARSEPLVLVAFRAADLRAVDLERAFTAPAFRFVTLGLPGNLPPNVVNLATDEIPFAELLTACDLVLSKPGYGLVADVIAARKPLLYTSRDDFAEYDVLVRGLQAYATSAFIPREAFFRGAWSPYLEELRRQAPHWPEVALDGATRAAEIILKRLPT